MFKAKKALILCLRLALVYVAMLMAYILGTMVIGQDGTVLSPQETDQAGKALLLVSLASALVLSFLILRSRYHGLKLVGVTFFVHFGVETFMTQIETLYFNSAVQMEASMLVGIVAAGALRALVFAPLAVLILGKMKRPAQPQTDRTTVTEWGKRFIALSLLYAVIYFLFGYFVAWQ